MYTHVHICTHITTHLWSVDIHTPAHSHTPALDQVVILCLHCISSPYHETPTASDSKGATPMEAEDHIDPGSTLVEGKGAATSIYDIALYLAT